MSLITCGSIHKGHEWFSSDSRGRQEIYMCLAALLCDQEFCRFANGGAKISIKSYFMRSATGDLRAGILVQPLEQVKGWSHKHRNN